MEAQGTELMSALATLLEAGKYSDLTITCGVKRYAVHRAIICSRSGFFDGACSNPFREAETGIIDLSEDEPEAVEHMVNYFYHLDYLSAKKNKSRRASIRRTTPGSSPIQSRPTSPITRRPKKPNLALVEDPLLATAAAYAHASAAPQQTVPPTPPIESDSFEFFSGKASLPDSAIEIDDDPFELTPINEQEPRTEEPHLVTHAKVYAIAEKYGITGLKSLARAKFATQVSHHWTCDEFASSMAEVYESTVDTDRGLRDVVIQAFRAHPEIARRKDIEEVVKDCPSLAWELFRVGWGLPVTS